MKSIVTSFIIACAVSSSVAADEANRQSHIEIGPLSVSVITSASEPGKPAKTAFLGVVTAPLSPQLRAQLELPEGMGLSVEAVAKDSPAEQAGIRQYDVLKKFNDQMLCSQEQLAVLVKAAGKDAKVSLAVLRGGKEQTITATLAEHDAQPMGEAGFSFRGSDGSSKLDIDGVLNQVLNELMRGGGDAKDGIKEKMKNEIKTQVDAITKSAESRVQEKLAENAVEESERKTHKMQAAKAAQEAEAAMRKSEFLSKPQVFSIYPGATSQSAYALADADGSIEVTDSDGKRTVKIADPSGKEIYSGPLNNDDDRAAVPEKFRDKVKGIEGKIKTPADGGVKFKSSIEIAPSTK